MSLRAFYPIDQTSGHLQHWAGPSDRLGAAILHDEAGAVVFGRSGLRHYLSSFVRPLLSATQKEISASLNNQKVRFK